MFLSIIIPVYNNASHIEECLTSCLTQDLPEDDYEIICINDGSTDQSGEIIASYAASHPNIVSITQENGGVSSARNAGMEIAKGNYFWFVDGDDFIQENSLKELKQIAENTKCDSIAFQMYLFYDTLNKEELQLKKINKLKCNKNLQNPAVHLFSSRVLTGIKWREGIEYGEDTIFIREYALKSPSVVKIDKVLYFYRQNNLSVTYRPVRNAVSRLHSHVSAALIMKTIYNSENGKCEANANALCLFIVFALQLIASHFNSETKAELSRLKAAKLFPFRKPPECTQKSCYGTARKDIVGKVFNWLCMNSGTIVGFALLRTWYSLYGLIKKAH